MIDQKEVEKAVAEYKAVREELEKTFAINRDVCDREKAARQKVLDALGLLTI